MERRTQAERRQASRERLLAAAIKLLGTRGYAGTSLAEIGKEAGLSRGLASHYFGTKEACMLAVVDTIREKVAARLSTKLRGAEALDHLLDVYLSGVGDEDMNARAMYVILIEGVTATPGLRPAVAETNAAVRQIISDLIGDAARANAVSVLVEGLLRGVALQWLADPDNVDLRATAACAKVAVRATLETD